MDLRNQQNNTWQKGKNKKHTRSVPPNVDYSYVYGKMPPQARDLEEAVLGAIMLEKGVFDLVAGVFTSPEVFYVDANKKIFQAMVRLSAACTPIDIMTVVEQLRYMGELDLVGGPFYVSTLTNNVVSSANIEAHARIVYQRYISRELIRISGEILHEAYEDTTDCFDLLDKTEVKLFAISAEKTKTDTKHISFVYDKQLTQLKARMQAKEDITGVPSGFPSLDRITAGWQPTDLIILAARPSMGKTALALNLVRNAALHPSKPTGAAIFCMEMNSGQLNDRIVSAESGVELKFITRGKLTEDELFRVEECRGIFTTAPLFIDDTPALTLFELRAKCRRLVKNHGVGLIVIDYLQLMGGGDDQRSGNREQEISRISRGLKQMAKELHVPVIALSQLSRDVEKRKEGNQIPQLSDLRESGAIEQDADMVLFLYRPDYGKEAKDVDAAMRNDASLKIAKHRNGELDTIALRTNLAIQKFYDLTEVNDAERRSRFIPFSEAEKRFSIEVPPAPTDGIDDLPF